MTVEQRTYLVKSFEEFSEEEQAKIIDKHRYDEVECISMTDFSDIYYTDIVNAGFNNPEIYYDLSCCQGSGACFECDSVDFDKLLEGFECKHKKWLKSYLEQYCSGRVVAGNLSNHYCHERTRYFDYENYCNYEYKHMEKLVNEFFDYVEQRRLEVCEKLYSDLQKDYDYRTSDENVKEMLTANEYLFNENTYCIEG